MGEFGVFGGRYLSRVLWLLVVGVVASVVVVGCSGEGVSERTPASVATVESVPSVTGEATSTAVADMATPNPTEALRPTDSVDSSTPEPTPVVVGESPTAEVDGTPEFEPTEGYDSSENMFRLFSGAGHDNEDSLRAIELAVANRDRSMVPLLIEMLPFYDDYVLGIETRKALTAITGREVRGLEGSWRRWMEWLVMNAEEYQAPEGYLDWKIGLMSLIDPRFEGLLAPAAEGSGVNLFELAWGGVGPDGIPDLQNAPVVSAEEQEYLEPEERVFGVSINGEHRAYPHRIVNAHEMANDVLGGEPIALAY